MKPRIFKFGNAWVLEFSPHGDGTKVWTWHATQEAALHTLEIRKGQSAGFRLSEIQREKARLAALSAAPLPPQTQRKKCKPKAQRKPREVKAVARMPWPAKAWNPEQFQWRDHEGSVLVHSYGLLFESEEQREDAQRLLR